VIEQALPPQARKKREAARAASTQRPTVEAKQERSRATREALLDAFMDLLHERPYADIRPADIAQRAGLTHGALYGRFGDKRGAVLALYERFAAESGALMESWGAQEKWASATSDAIIENWTRGAVNFCRMHRPFMALMMDDPAVRELYEELMMRPPRILARLLRAAARGRALPDDFDADVEWAARAALAVLERFDLDDDGLYERIENLLSRLTTTTV